MNDLVQAVAAFASEGDGAGRMTPCLIGPTGVGKTARVEQLACEHGMPLLRVLLGTSLPEDVLGLPRVVETAHGYVTRWAVAETWVRASEEPCVVLLDEIDKAHPATHGAVLTLLWSREVHGLRLHPDTMLIAAMQPVVPDEWLSDETGRALSARLVYVPVAETDAWAHIQEVHKVDLGLITAAGEPPVLPILPRPAPRQVDWWLRFAAHHPVFAEQAAAGMFTPDVTRALMGVLRDEGSTIVESSLRRLFAEGRGGEAVASAPISVLIACVDAILMDGMPEDLVALIRRIDLEASTDEITALLHAVHEFVDSRGGTVDIWPRDPRTSDETVRWLGDALERLVRESPHWEQTL